MINILCMVHVLHVHELNWSGRGESKKGKKKKKKPQPHGLETIEGICYTADLLLSNLYACCNLHLIQDHRFKDRKTQEEINLPKSLQLINVIFKIYSSVSYI